MRKVLSYSLRWFVSLTALVLALVVSRGVAAQSNPDPFGFKFNSGQSVQPIFEGWSRTAGGGFLMHFGYLNRNYVETMEIPVGPDNKLDPGDPDRGQPTFFNARIHRMAFSVPVPGDWGKRELVWSVTVHGKTEKAVGWLEPEWEIDPVYFGKKRTEESLKNTPPKLTLDVPTAVTLPNTLTLAATVADDGLPVPRKRRPAAVGQETPPTLKPLPDQPDLPVNVPAIGSPRGRLPQTPLGLAVTWTVWRGPAAVAFNPTSPIVVKDGKAVTTATFTKPGTYVLRVIANDGELKDQKDVTVTVALKTTSQQ